jgi:hypothetical protein
MSNIALYKYDSWNDFKFQILKELYPDIPFKRHKFLFRGQANPEWQLISSFDRIFEDKRDADKILTHFINECKNQGLFDEKILTDKNVALALGQHYGLPTRLLDWSESPYFAAFFAFTGAISSIDKQEHVAIWVFNNDENIWRQDLGVQIINALSLPNIRLRNQFGKFTLLKSPFNSLEEHIKQIKTNTDAPLLIKCLIPSSDIIMALADLDAMGINFIRVYPEIEGLVLNSRIKTLYNLE